MAAPRGQPTVNVSTISRVSGLLVGLSLALVALIGARVPAGTGEVPASASLKAEPSVKLGITPVGRELLSERRLAPGESVSGLVQVSNLTGASLLATPHFHTVRGEAPADLAANELFDRYELRFQSGLDKINAEGRGKNWSGSLCIRSADLPESLLSTVRHQQA